MMTVIVVNNYFRRRFQDRVNKIIHALKNTGEKRYELWNFSNIGEKNVREDVEVVILSGSSAHLQNSVHSQMYDAETEFIRQATVPILGICFGHQLIGRAFGSQIRALPTFISGFKPVTILKSDELFSNWREGEQVVLAQSHRDCLTDIPKNLVRLAESETCAIEAVKHRNRPIYGIQAHIERVSNKYPFGHRILENFFYKVK